jgi:D-glycero-D-manno-heptose 1,7-bisphosphate phosphatase
MTPTPLAILDRDGVINHESDAFIKRPGEWQPIPGALEAIARLSLVGWQVAIATNQSGLARGLFDIDALNAIHAELMRRVQAVGGAIDLIAFCPHGPDDDCDCRKPLPGLLHQISRRLDRSLVGVPVIGDSWRDLEAARRVGGRPILVLTGRGEQTREAHAGELVGTAVVDDLAAAVDLVLGEYAGDRRR